MGQMRQVLAAALVAAVAGCGSYARLNSAPPADRYETAQITGYHHIRFYGDADLGPASDDRKARQLRGRSDAERLGALMAGDIATATPVDPDALDTAVIRQVQTARKIDVLLLSGGGDGGAYGAGLLKGWTARGDRPEFQMVTGVSTGALIAPLAFLGPRYDPMLESFYTQTSSADIFLLRPFKALFGAMGVADSGPLQRQIAQVVTPQMVDDIAQQRRRGRLLLIGTTDLDAQRQVIWDIGRIAASDQPDKVALIRRILLASASIPGAFPPVPVNVTVDGKAYQELHVDGGVTRGVFAYPPRAVMPWPRGPRRMWVVRNSKMSPEYVATRAGVLAIASRSLSTLIKSQASGDVAALQSLARRDGFDFRVTAVPPTFPITPDKPFDATYMRSLFATGEKVGRSGQGWFADAGPLSVPSTAISLQAKN
ncbi:patatin-like phospholipase family protein [Paracoccus jiaweipingae]|uniref:patatin-like phospholipase family protein n=1 Tax=unclassified Paracoccus (in: a-proteobacteria) TaxID=2688777 RepID=UPI0037AA86A1